MRSIVRSCPIAMVSPAGQPVATGSHMSNRLDRGRRRRRLRVKRLDHVRGTYAHRSIPRRPAMFILKRYKVRNYEMGLLFREGEFRGLRTAGRHWFFDPLNKVVVDVV